MSKTNTTKKITLKRKVMKDSKDQKKPSLRISHIVYGRKKRGNRVYYLVDEKGQGSEMKIAEQVVLHRWRKRKFSDFTFSGSRLNPGIWRVLPKVIGNDYDRWLSLGEKDLENQINAHRELMRKNYETLPATKVLIALFQFLGKSRLVQIVNRHNDPARAGKFGIPDLFLYATDNKSGKVVIARFVEVKKPEEKLSKDQIEEISFLQSLGLHARVLRLIEH